jgi:hypothetical protein
LVLYSMRGWPKAICSVLSVVPRFRGDARRNG